MTFRSDRQETMTMAGTFFPYTTPDPLGFAARVAEMAEAYDATKSLRRVAAQFDIGVDRLRSLLSQHRRGMIDREAVHIDEMQRAIWTAYRDGLTQAAIARDAGVKETTVTRIVVMGIAAGEIRRRDERAAANLRRGGESRDTHPSNLRSLEGSASAAVLGCSTSVTADTRETAAAFLALMASKVLAFREARMAGGLSA
jgi:hypothetical protein